MQESSGDGCVAAERWHSLKRAPAFSLKRTHEECCLGKHWKPVRAKESIHQQRFVSTTVWLQLLRGWLLSPSRIWSVSSSLR